MKKFFMFAAMASVALVSCVKNEPGAGLSGSGEQNLISFEAPILAPAVKSVQEIVQFPADKTFQIWAYYTQENFAGTAVASNEYMNNVQIKYWDREGATNYKWTAQDKYYWPNSGYLTFVGYAGTVTNDDVVATGLKFDYAVNAAADEDLLVSQVAYNLQRPAAPSANDQANYTGQVQVQFEHALASLVFKVKSGVYESNGAGINTDLAVTKIEVIGVHNTGSFSQGFTTWATGNQMIKPEITAGDPASAVVTDGWSAQAGTTTYTAFTTSGSVPHKELTGVPQLVHDIDAATADYSVSNLIVLPQTIPADATLKITYDFRNDSMGAGVWITGNTATAKLSTDYVPTWMRGYRYTYNVTLTLDEITFDPEVSAWVDYVPADPNNNHVADYPTL